ncbi:hypothetical protein [Actinoallomurus acaciae]|uniref:Uncharacterized protein n=1 Tax=Actinoallomurus acaciae TaxID=502577 RepID=A0ABV5Y8W8_9ACTN
MTTSSLDDWSPADSPYAIAVSEAQWWLHAVELTVFRMREGEERWTHPFNAEQVDARLLILALRQLLTAEQLEQAALRDLDVDPAVGQALTAARQRFDGSLPGLRHMRNALTHFDAWSRGQGYGPQKDRRDAGEPLRDIARVFSAFGYDPGADTVTLGPYTIHVRVALEAAYDLCEAVCAAAHEVDKKTAADLRVKALQVLTNAGIQPDTVDALLQLLHGFDLRLVLFPDSDGLGDERAKLAQKVINALTSADICLISSVQPGAQDITMRLVGGEWLYVRPGADVGPS